MIDIARGRIATALVALTGLSQAAWAASDAPRCASERRWDDFSSVAIAVSGSFGDAQAPVVMKVKADVYDDGSVVVADMTSHLEVIWWSRPEGRVALGNVASAPMELGEVSTVYDAPLATVRGRFHGPCDLREKTRYAVRASSGGAPLSGHVEREGNSIRFDLHGKQGHDEIGYAGEFAYSDSRGTIPANRAISGWTIFRDSISPEKGERSTFATLGDLQRGGFLHDLGKLNSP